MKLRNLWKFARYVAAFAPPPGERLQTYDAVGARCFKCHQTFLIGTEIGTHERLRNANFYTHMRKGHSELEAPDTSTPKPPLLECTAAASAPPTVKSQISSTSTIPTKAKRKRHGPLTPSTADGDGLSTDST
ncbi:hypothetical protein GN958_ATG16787 [Phytophthora infestans]|uniref:Uncharacterized protein n=1 Tax=Phytophthora infestans TaxID=4787 RepID=A0A8S9TZ91_PHYIN|nr:hypothetical protein GN958_ATG16787 [Phytophthora infestans]